MGIDVQTNHYRPRGLGEEMEQNMETTVDFDWSEGNEGREYRLLIVSAGGVSGRLASSLLHPTSFEYTNLNPKP